MRQAVLALVAVAACLPSTAPANADFSDVVGPYPVTTFTDAGPNGAYYISQPTTLYDDAHPLAVFCVGTNGSPANGQALFESLASHGIIVIAGKDPNQGEGDQAVAGIEWLIEQDTTAQSPYYGKLITSNVMAFGLSQGGNAALWTAIRENQSAPNTITSVIAMAPGATEEQARKAPVSEIDVPVFYVAGAWDVIVPATRVHEQYAANASPAWYASKTRVGHLGILRNAAVDYYIRAWAFAHLFGDPVAAAEFYGESWGLDTDWRFRQQSKNNSLDF